MEIAGLALGAFPLLIRALEHFRDTAEVLHNWWRFERVFSNFKIEIEYQQQRLKQNLELNLLPLIIDDDERLQALITNPGGPRWKDRNLEEKLKERLLDNYSLYMDTIEIMNGVMEKLKAKLSIGHSVSEYEMRRFIFGLDQAPRDELLGKLDKYNTRLRDLLETSDKITDIRKKGALAKAQRSLLSFWKHANAIYCLLQCAWKQNCCRSHHADLFLEHRKSSEVTFTVLFRAGDNVGEPSAALWLWQTACIKLFKVRDSDEGKTEPQNITHGSPQLVLQTQAPPSGHKTRRSLKGELKQLFKPSQK
jgi:hypothetical protein